MRGSLLLGLALLAATPATGAPGQAYSCVVDRFHYNGPWFPLDPEYEQLNLAKTFIIRDEGDHFVVVASAPGWPDETRDYPLLTRQDHQSFALIPPGEALRSLALLAFDEPHEPAQVIATLTTQSFDHLNVWYLACRHEEP